MTSEPAATEAVEEPLPEIARTLVAVGTAFLGDGTSSYRVERALDRAGRVMGCDRVISLVALRAVVITVERDGQTWTESARTAALHINADHLNRLEFLIRRLPRRTTAATLRASLEEVLSRPGYYPAWATAVGVGIACGAFAALSGGHITETVAAGIAAGTGQAVRSWLLRRHLNPFAVVTIVAALAATLYLSLVGAATSLDLVQRANESGFVSSVLFLVPGFALVSGTLDLLRVHVEAGVARVTYAVTVLVMASLGLLAVAGVADPPLPQPTGMSLDAATFVIYLGWTALGGAGFAVLFNLPPRLVLAAALVAAAGNAVRLALLDSGSASTTAALAGATVVGLVAAAVAVRTHTTRIVLAIPGVIPMVPGATAYTGLVALSQGTLLPAIERGAEATLIIGSLAIGLALARILTDREWAFGAS